MIKLRGYSGYKDFGHIVLQREHSILVGKFYQGGSIERPTMGRMHDILIRAPHLDLGVYFTQKFSLTPGGQVKRGAKQYHLEHVKENHAKASMPKLQRTM